MGTFSERLLRRIYTLLPQRGRLVIVDKFAPAATVPPRSRLSLAFLDSLEHPSETMEFATAAAVQTRLKQAGFRDVCTRPVPPEDELPWNVEWSMLEAVK